MNKVESMEYIKQHFPKPISRRTFYNYKKLIYNNYSLFYNKCEGDTREDSLSFKETQTTNTANCKQLNIFLLFDIRENLIQKGLRMNIDLDDLDKLNFFPIHFINSLNHAKSVITHSKNRIEQYELKSHSNNNNRKSLPVNVTIRREYVKCGKNSCKKCKHGPYYYGYWREKNGKLKKKYIGINK